MYKPSLTHTYNCFSKKNEQAPWRFVLQRRKEPTLFVIVINSAKYSLESSSDDIILLCFLISIYYEKHYYEH